jgi:hypothetical protein
MIAAVLMREGRLTLQSARRSSDALGPEEGVAHKGTRPPTDQDQRLKMIPRMTATAAIKPRMPNPIIMSFVPTSLLPVHDSVLLFSHAVAHEVL